MRKRKKYHHRADERGKKQRIVSASELFDSDYEIGKKYAYDDDDGNIQKNQQKRLPKNYS